MLSILAALALLGLIGWYGATHWRPSSASYPVQGIDVSHHQGAIDWPAVHEAGVDFAWIKASEGGDWHDPRFTANWAGAARAGVRRGAYHFFTLCRPGAEQAANFIATVPVDPTALAPVVDLEFVGNCARRPSRAEVHRELAAFIALVESHYGKQAILYVITDFDDYYGVTEAFDRRLWLRALFHPPAYGARDWTIWQASAFRSVSGIEGPTDWNVLHPDITLEDLS